MAITINVRTMAVRLDPDTPVMARNQFGNATYGYVRGHIEPNYPVPALNLEVIPMVIEDKCIGIDIVNRSNEHDPWPVVAFFDLV